MPQKEAEDDAPYELEENPETFSKVDEIISQLISIQNKPVGTLVHLRLEQIEWLIEQSLALIQS